MNKLINIKDRDIRDILLNLKQLTFEVTDACNLRCKYCGYGELYEGYDKREAKYLSTVKAKILLNYLIDNWEKGYQKGICQVIYISFYGGEPLMNMTFIEEIINYIDSLPYIGKKFVFSMTTNAVLLDKYIDYLVEKNVQLLISLDGDKRGQSYRIDHRGENSFDKVWRNIKLIQEKYAKYYKDSVNFNSVLHDRNTVEGIHEFIYKNLKKYPTIAELNKSGVCENKLKEFQKLYRNKSQSLYQANQYEKISQEIFLKDPDIRELAIFLHRYSGNVFEDYNDLLKDDKQKSWVGTGTCLPFSKKIFLTVNGKILPCERINHCFVLGQVYENYVDLDLKKVANSFNYYKNKLKNQCKTCYYIKGCTQCMYNIKGIGDEGAVICQKYMNKKNFLEYKNSMLNYLYGHSKLYERIMKEVIME